MSGGTLSSGRRVTFRGRRVDPPQDAGESHGDPPPPRGAPEGPRRIVRQMGLLVAPDRLRFDYAAARPTTAAEIPEIERLVNEEILSDRPVRRRSCRWTSEGEGRDDVLRREVRRAGPRRRRAGLLDRALRRLPRRADRRDRRVQGPLGRASRPASAASRRSRRSIRSKGSRKTRRSCFSSLRSRTTSLFTPGRRSRGRRWILLEGR